MTAQKDRALIIYLETKIGQILVNRHCALIQIASLAILACSFKLVLTRSAN